MEEVDCGGRFLPAWESLCMGPVIITYTWKSLQLPCGICLSIQTDAKNCYRKMRELGAFRIQNWK
jgi:hypothetical protein